MGAIEQVLTLVGNAEQGATRATGRQGVAIVYLVVDLIHGKGPSCRVDDASRGNGLVVINAFHYGALQRTDGHFADIAVVLGVFFCRRGVAAREERDDYGNEHRK